MLRLHSTMRTAAQSVAAPRSMAARAMSTNAGEYDLVVIGGGPAGYTGAVKAGQMGMKVACVEGHSRLGGTCLNVGCIPSKALLNATHMLHVAQHDFKKLGIEVAQAPSMDFDKMMNTKTKTVNGLTDGIAYLFKKNKVDRVSGYAKITGKNQVSVALKDGGNETLTTKNILICSGSEVTPLPPVPVDNEAGKIVDSTGALSLKKVPEHMVVVGGGVIGLELGSVYKRLGAKVTVVEFLDHILPGNDKEVIKEMTKILKKQGMKFKMGTKVTASKVEGEKVTLTMEPSKGGDAETLECDTVLVSTGRRPFTKGLGCEDMGIQINERGQIETDDHYRTNIPNIYAVGDVIKGAMLAHKGEEEAIAAVEIMNGKPGHVDYNTIPGVVYTHPEVAMVGKTEEQLKEEGIEYNVGKFPLMANSRAKANLDSDGFVKVLAAKTDDEVLGCHIIASNAGEMIAEGVLGMEYGAASEDISRTCHAHPTLSEAFKEACADAHGKPINF